MATATTVAGLHQRGQRVGLDESERVSVPGQGHTRSAVPAPSRHRSLVFDGADAPLQALRAAARARTLPDGCDHPRDRRVPAIRSECRKKEENATAVCVPVFGHGGEGQGDWFGHAHPGAHTSCGFTAVSFRPTAATVSHTLGRQVYMTSGHVEKQCAAFGKEKASNGERSRWLADVAPTCHGNNFPMDFLSEQECLDRAVDSTTNGSTLGLPGRFNCTGPTCIVPMRFGDLPLPALARLGATSHGVLPHPPYLVHARNAVLTESVRTADESYVTVCSPFWYIAADFKKHRPDRVRTEGGRWLQMDSLQRDCRAGSSACPIPRHKKVVYLSQVYAGEYFHFAMEIWPRIAPFIEAFRRDPELVFHTSYSSRNYSAKAHAMQAPFFELLGIPPDRLISEAVFAEEVIIPQVGYSHNPALNLWPILAVRDDVEHRYGFTTKPAHIAQSARPLVVVVLVRDVGRRQDGKYFTDAWMRGLEGELPRHRVVPFVSSNTTMMRCFRCQVEVFQHADVVVGAHGAGLVHLMWVPPRATVIELLNEGSMIYREMALMLGQKYFILPTKSSAGDVARMIRVADKDGVGAMQRDAASGAA